MGYVVKELFKTLQGEGGQAGRAAVFCRFTGCNLWSGREEDRAQAVCQFCDTDFVGTDGENGGRYADAIELARKIENVWGHGTERRLVVFTGGEPLLQIDAELVAAMHSRKFEIAVETNGTLEATPGIDWVCVSPKAGAELVQKTGNELKLVFPQKHIAPIEYEGLAFEHFWLQPMDGPDREENTKLAVAYCMANPRWRVSVQTHKYMGIP